MSELAEEALAAYRIWRLAAKDEILARPRGRFERWATEHERFLLLELIDCPWCMTIWIGAGAVVARLIAPKPWKICRRLLAASAAAGLIAEIVAKLED